MHTKYMHNTGNSISLFLLSIFFILKNRKMTSGTRQITKHWMNCNANSILLHNPKQMAKYSSIRGLGKEVSKLHVVNCLI